MKSLRFLAAFAALLTLTSLAQAQTQYQFPTTPWQAFAPARIECGQLLGANFNVTTDQAIPISVPTQYMIDVIAISNPSVSLTTAQGGFYTAASKAGVAVVASSQAYTALTTATANTTGNALLATISTAGNTTYFNGFAQSSQISTLYFSLTTAQGAAATADIRIFCKPLF
jgi:hypothetical protein